VRTTNNLSGMVQTQRDRLGPKGHDHVPKQNFRTKEVLGKQQKDASLDLDGGPLRFLIFYLGCCL
jgi:hypothetical protein